jgi:hypothetical protein
MKFPRTKTLARSISNTEIRPGTSAAASAAYLLSKRAELQPYVTSYDLVVAAEAGTAPSGAIHHLSIVLRAVTLELWRRQIFIGWNAIESILFRCFRDGSVADPILEVVEIIARSGVHRPGFVVYPLHSFGILGAGLAAFAGTTTRFHLPGLGLVLSPQASLRGRDHDSFGLFLEDVRRALDIRAELDGDLVKHWVRSRGLEWTSQNPLAAVRVRSFPGDYYENQRMLTDTIDFASSTVCLMAALQRSSGDADAFRLFSSRIQNNWETLDIDHYIVLFPKPGGRRLGGDCVPFRAQRETLVDLCELALDIDPREWKSRRALAQQICRASARVQAGYFKWGLYTADTSSRARLYRKLRVSLSFFRRSFRRDPPRGTVEVNLATAFEVLLTERYEPGVTNRLLRRVERLLPAAHRGPGKQTVKDLYESRSKLVHEGTVVKCDLPLARQTFARVFVRLSERLVGWNVPARDPIGHMVGDAPEH